MPSSNISIDEAIIRCTRPSQDTYETPFQPIPEGLKFDCAAAHGFVFDFHPPSQRQVVFVTGRGGAVFHSPDHALTWVRRGYFSGNHGPAPVRGPPALIPWTGPRLLPPIFNGNPSGVWVARGLERGQGQGMPKKTTPPRLLSGAGRGKGPGARVFRGPVRPVTTTS